MKKFKRPDHRDSTKFTCLCPRCSQIYYQTNKSGYEANPQGILYVMDIAYKEHRCVWQR